MTSKRMTRAETIRWLGDAISTETKKPFDEIDYDFVDECSCLLDELMGKSSALSDEEIAVRLAKLTIAGNQKKMGRRKFWKVAVAAAVVLCMSITVIAVPELRVKLMKALQLDVGESVEEDGITYIHTGEPKSYSDIDELIAAEDLNILSYKGLDDNLLITTINYISDISKTIITFNDPTINFYIEHNVNVISDTIKNNSEKFTTPYFDAYIVDKAGIDNIRYNAYFIHKNNMYNINCTDKNKLISILNSLYSGE